MIQKALSLEQIRLRLSNFQQPPADSLGWNYFGMHRHRIDSSNYAIWRILRFIFAEALSFHVFDQPFEKTNWVIPFTYKNTYTCAAVHEKFGFRIYVKADTEAEAESTGQEIEDELHKAILSVKPIVEQYAQVALSKGEIIVENSYNQLHRPYDYFRKKALSRKKTLDLPIEKKLRKNWHQTIWEKEYYEQATYFSFFSLLEHLCVLFLAYRNTPERSNVASFSRLKWSDKFKIVFDIRRPEFKAAYDQFVGISRFKRNPAAHGYANTVFDFYLEGARHKISVTINDDDIGVIWRNQNNNFDSMESFLKLLKTDPTTRNIFAYIQAGLNISFTKNSLIANDMLARMPEQECQEYIEYMTRLSDDMANMDW